MSGGDELSVRAKARLGTVVDEKWRLDSVLGVGGMAVVYSATHRNGKRAAVKILHPEVALNRDVKARFLREGYVANKVEHPGAVSILDDDEAGGHVFLVMELLEGETLEAKYAGQKMAEGDVLTMADQLLDVLVAAHERNIVHRDLKPGNLFVTTDGTIKVLDFGIARLRELTGVHDLAGLSKVRPSATTMHSMGTPGFMPPEQARGLWEDVDARTDLWAVGATMFTLLTGRYVHEERTVNEQLLAGMTKPAPPLASVLADVAAPVAQVVDRALAFDRMDRWPDARAMQDAVKEAYFEITGRRISFARRLVVAPRVSLPDTSEAATSAPTLAADTSSQPSLLAESVDRIDRMPTAVAPKTTDGATMPSVPPPSRAVTAESHRNRGRRLAVVAGGVGVGGVVIAAYVMRGPARVSGGEGVAASGSGSGSGSGLAVVSPGVSIGEVASVAPSAGTSPSPSPSTSTTTTTTPTTTTTAGTAAVVAPHASLRPVVVRPKASASAAPSAAPVDLFGRRR
ncbi:MAG: serine/threonine protein kinase [Myxococcaceae bacterium]|nr:serine/threonine protein kinase [Myxococcaceae bacterium]